MASSSALNGNRVITRTRRGIRSMMIMGNPIAAARGIRKKQYTDVREKNTNGLSYSKGCTKGDKLYADKEQNARLAHPAKRIVS